LRFVITYQMMTGVVERFADTEIEARGLVDALLAAGARPIRLETEDEFGVRRAVAYVPYGDAAPGERASVERKE